MRVLSVHAAYRCAHAGACCTSGWTIPIERVAARRVEGALAAGRLRARGEPLVRLGGLPQGASQAVAHDARGRCAFRGDDARCSIHSVLGPDALPAACRHFPRVAVLGPDAVEVTLSHYCPTAAGLLFEDQGPLRIVDHAPSFPAGAEYEGLDATRSLGPLLRRGVLLPWAAYRRWQAHAVGVLARPKTSIEEDLARLEADAARLADWKAGEGGFDLWLEATFGSATAVGDRRLDIHRAAGTHARVLAAGDAPRTASPPTGHWARWGADAWPRFARPLKAYAAAKVVASWPALQGEGIVVAVAAVRMAVEVVAVEAARRAVSEERRLDEPHLREAIRAADLLLVHHADPEALARALA